MVVPHMPQKVRIPGKLLLTNFALVSLLACVCQKVLIAIRLPCEPLGAHWALEGSLTGVVIPHMLFAVVFPVVKAQVWSQIQKFQKFALALEEILWMKLTPTRSRLFKIDTP